MSFPTGIAHVNQIAKICDDVRRKSEKELQHNLSDIKLFGTSMSILYQASTCHRKCIGGSSHVLEGLAGRAFNLGQASYILINRGLYDEALNLIRSLGEISNLIHMSVVDKPSLKKWLKSDKTTRIREFSPAKIRKILKIKDVDLVPATQDWYSRFCEEYTHITPQTKPNPHNMNNLPHVGPVFQKDGLELSLNELSGMLFTIALSISGYFEFTDLWDELCEIVKNEN